MNNGPLIWKEWHEQSWKLAFSCIVLCALAYIGLRSRIMPDEEMIQIVCFIGFMLLPILSCSGLIPAERGDRTLQAVMSLPITPRRIIAVKMIAGLVLSGGPIVAAAVVSLLLASARELSPWAIVEFYLRSLITALSLFVWIQTLTIRLPTEARAALLSVGIVVMWLMLSGAFEVIDAPRIVSALSPFASVFNIAERSSPLPLWWPVIPVQCVSAGLLFLASSRSLAFDSGR